MDEQNGMGSSSPGQSEAFNGLSPSPTPASSQSPVVYPQQPGIIPIPPPKRPWSKGKLLLIVCASVLVAGALLAGAVFSLVKDGTDDGLNAGRRRYDSPAGLLLGFQKADIKSGTFKLTADYITGATFVREGKFAVNDRGELRFEMLTDRAKVNDLLKFLYEKGDTKIPYDEGIHGATSNFSFNFASILGYHYLHDKNATVFGNFIPQIEAAIADPKSVEDNKLYKLGPACDDALRIVKAKTGSAINTSSLEFETTRDGAKSTSKISHASLASIDNAVISFFENCFDFSQPSLVEYDQMLEKLKANTTKSPQFVYWQEGATQHLQIKGDSPHISGVFEFEFKGLSQDKGELPEATASFNERRNLFGLAYSHCRVVPVVTSDFMASFSYRFSAEDTSYRYPNEFDSGYYCSTLALPPQYRSPDTLSLAYEQGVTATASGGAIDKLRAVHEIVYLIEKYNLDKKRYPSQTEYIDLANNNTGALRTVAQGLVTGKSIEYAPEPTGCVGECNDYTFTYQLSTNVQSVRQAYRP